jgi:DNA-binding transcriptional LysR family regulator
MGTANGTHAEHFDLNRVAIFVNIAEAKGVSAAAARVHLPKSSVSRALTHLEDELGVELIVRRGRTFQLTDAGQRLYDAAAKGLAALREARDELRPDASVPRGLLRIAAPATFASYLVSPAMVGFVRRFPAVEIELCVTAAKVDPVRDGFDIVVSVGPLEDSSAIVRRLATVDAGIFASREYLAEREVPRRPSDLPRYDCILQTSSTSKTRWTLRGPGGESEVTVRGRITVDDQSAAIAAARVGGGLVVLPIHAPDREPSLVRVLPDYQVPGETVQIVHAASRHVPRRISMFRDALIEACRSACTETKNGKAQRSEP